MARDNLFVENPEHSIWSMHIVKKFESMENPFIVLRYLLENEVQGLECIFSIRKTQYNLLNIHE